MYVSYLGTQLTTQWFRPQAPNGSINDGRSKGSLSIQEAMDLERQAYLRDEERQQRIVEKRRRLGIPTKGEILSREEKEARIWAFM
jgi:hypothetical protein